LNASKFIKYASFFFAGLFIYFAFIKKKKKKKKVQYILLPDVTLKPHKAEGIDKMIYMERAYRGGILADEVRAFFGINK
jgi:hypothetical protein